MHKFKTGLFLLILMLGLASYFTVLEFETIQFV